MKKKKINGILEEVKEDLEKLDRYFKIYKSDCYKYPSTMTPATEVLGDQGIEVLIGICIEAKPKWFKGEKLDKLQDYNDELRRYVGDIETSHPADAEGPVHVNGDSKETLYPKAREVLAGNLRYIIQTGGRVLSK